MKKKIICVFAAFVCLFSLFAVIPANAATVSYGDGSDMPADVAARLDYMATLAQYGEDYGYMYLKNWAWKDEEYWLCVVFENKQATFDWFIQNYDTYLSCGVSNLSCGGYKYTKYFDDNYSALQNSETFFSIKNSEHKVIYTNLENIPDFPQEYSSFVTIYKPEGSSSDTSAPFEVIYPENFGEDMSRGITITGHNGYSWEDENNILTVQVKLTDSFLSKTAQYSEISDMTYGVVCAVSTAPITQSAQINQFLDNEDICLFLAYHDGYYMEGTSKAILEQTHAADFNQENKRCKGLTPIYTLDRTKPVTIQIDLTEVNTTGLSDNQPLYLNFLGCAANSPMYYSSLSVKYIEDKDLIGAYPYAGDFTSIVEAPQKDNWIVNQTSMSDYDLVELYRVYAISSDPFYYEDYPPFDPKTITYIDKNGREVELDLGGKLSDMIGIPPNSVTDLTMVKDIGEVSEEEYDEIKKSQRINTSVDVDGIFSITSLQDIFNGVGDYYNFITYSIGVLPSIFISIVLHFFACLSILVLAKYALSFVG